MTKTMNEQTNDTIQDQILKILFAEGLGACCLIEADTEKRSVGGF